MNKLICFNSGSLCIQDNAREVMKLLENGSTLFEILLRYDDLLTLERRENYEPGNILSLIAPILLANGITENDISKISKNAKPIPGAKELLNSLRAEWHIVLISTSYLQHALNVAAQFGIPRENVVATKMPLDSYVKNITQDDTEFIKKTISELIAKFSALQNDDKLKEYLDNLFFNELPKTGAGSFCEEIKVIGGNKEIESLMNFAKQYNISFENIAVLGNNITDYKIMDFVRGKGGLSIAFNGDEYSMPYASFGIATTNLLDIKPITDAFSKGGKKAIVELMKQKEKENKPGVLPYFNMIEDADLKEVDEAVSMHKKAHELLCKL